MSRAHVCREAIRSVRECGTFLLDSDDTVSLLQMRASEHSSLLCPVGTRTQGQLAALRCRAAVVVRRR